MQNELLAVVDEYDQVISQQTRGQIHAQGLRHRAVHILVFNNEGQLFLQKRSMKKDLNKGLWDSSAAGHVDAGESYDQSAPRELQEELGVIAKALHPLFKLDAIAELGMEFIQVYRCIHNGPFILAADEIDDGRWLTPAAITDRVTSDDSSLTTTFKHIWRQYLKSSY